KPYFMKHYKKKFAKRLLYHHDDKNFNLSNEEWILSLFNRANIIDNLYGMIKDIHESIGIKKDFDIFNHLKVTILTGSYWPKFITGPSPEVADLKIPYELFLMRKSFQDYFYCKRRDGANRNLKWLHSYDNLIISLIHPKGKMYFSINMCMFIILEMFNYTRSYQISYTIREIMKNTELVLKSALSSLIFGEIKLLNKFVNSKRLNLSDAIFINENLNFIESTVDNPIIIDERKSQRQISTSEDVQISSYNISNEIRIDSRIMKLMKLHKRYQHNSFVVGYGEYGEYGDVTPTDYWEEDDNDCGHEYSCTNSKLHPYNNLCDITHKVVIHGVKAITHDVKAIAITHGVESIAHGVVEDIIVGNGRSSSGSGNW
ncbi:15253_t:CDS:2, partial [Entrophospora sp. SA101]